MNILPAGYKHFYQCSKVYDAIRMFGLWLHNKYDFYIASSYALLLGHNIAWWLNS